MENDLTQQFVDERVSRIKFERLVVEFNKEKDEFRKKGIIPLSIEFPFFEFAFLSQKSVLIIQNTGVIGVPSAEIHINPIFQEARRFDITYPSFLFSVRIDYSNYDIVAPSLRFINPCTSEEMQQVAASIIIRPDQQNKNNIVDERFNTQNQNLVIIDNERPFVCLRGLREYHAHSQHDGDPWSLYRNTKLGTLNDILDRLYLYSIHNMKLPNR